MEKGVCNNASMMRNVREHTIKLAEALSFNIGKLTEENPEDPSKWSFDANFYASELLEVAAELYAATSLAKQELYPGKPKIGGDGNE